MIPATPHCITPQWVITCQKSLRNCWFTIIYSPAVTVAIRYHVAASHGHLGDLPQELVTGDVITMRNDLGQNMLHEAAE